MFKTDIKETVVKYELNNIDHLRLIGDVYLANHDNITQNVLYNE